MSSVLSTNSFWRDALAERVPLWILTAFLLFLMAVLCALAVERWNSVSYSYDPALVAGVAHEKPSTSDAQNTQEKHDTGESSYAVVALSERELPNYTFNLLNNSFESLKFEVGRTSERVHGGLMATLERAGLGNQGAEEFVRELVRAASEENINPCYLLAIGLAGVESLPANSQVSLDTVGLLLLAGSKELAMSRVALAGMPEESKLLLDGTIPLKVLSRSISRYVAMLREVFGTRGNLTALSYWSDVATVQKQIVGRQSFSFNDLDLLKSITATYSVCEKHSV